MSDPVSDTTKNIPIADIITCLKRVSRSAGSCGEGEYRGAMWALNEIEALAGLPVSRDIGDE